MAAHTFVPTLAPLVNVVEQKDPVTGETQLVGFVTQPWRRFQEGVGAAITPGGVGEVLTSNGTSFVWQKLVNANVAVAAAIAYTKLNLALSILDADIAVAAAIAWSKVSKAGSSLADLATRSASDLTSGTLNAARLPSLSQMVMAVNASAAIGAGVTTYLGTLGSSTTETDIRMVMPVAGVLRNLYVVALAAPGAAQTFTYTARINAVDSTITCALSGAAATTGNDTTHTGTVAAGDVVTVKLVTSAGAAVTRHAIGVELATS